MKKIFILYLITLFFTNSNAQDRVILINGDTVKGQLLKIGNGGLNIKQGPFEREISSLFVNKVISVSGEELVIHQIPSDLNFESNFLVLKYSHSRSSELSIMFPQAIKREFNAENYRAFEQTPSEYFINEGSGIAGYSPAESYMRYIGYSCNAFLVIVNQTIDGAKYVFYSNPVSYRVINQHIIEKTYNLVDSKVSESASLLRYALNTSTTFTMKLNKGGECLFKQGKKESLLNYEVTPEAQIIFTDPKFPSKSTKYEVVFINDKILRYTQFEKNDPVVSRKVQVVN